MDVLRLEADLNWLDPECDDGAGCVGMTPSDVRARRPGFKLELIGTTGGKSS